MLELAGIMSEIFAEEHALHDGERPEPDPTYSNGEFGLIFPYQRGVSNG